MNKTITFLFLVALLLSACGPAGITTPTPLPTATQIPTPIPSPTPTPNVYVGKVNFFPELSGSLFAGSFFSGEYLELDFDTQQVVRYQLPKNCRLLSARRKAVCEINIGPMNYEIYIYDLTSGKHEFAQQMKDVYRWGVSGSENILFYIPNDVVDGGIPIYSYEFSTGLNELIGVFKDYDEYYVPWNLQMSRDCLIGTSYGENIYLDSDDFWFQLNMNTMDITPIMHP